MSVKNKPTNYRVRGLLLGLFLGYPLSYWFQPALVRMFASLGDYVVNIADVMTTEGMGPRALLTMLGCAILGAILGQMANGIVRAKQSPEG
jgi:hypothetical protein